MSNLIIAAHEDSETRFQLGIEAGEDVNGGLIPYLSPLRRAAISDSRNVCESLLEHGADPNHIVGSGAYLPLVHALNRKNYEIARILLEHGASVNAKNADGMSCLHAAVIFDDLSMMEYLIERGAVVNAIDLKGRTPLHLAARLGDIDAAERLLGAGAFASLRDWKDRSPEDVAREYGNNGVVVLLHTSQDNR